MNSMGHEWNRDDMDKDLEKDKEEAEKKQD